MSIGIFIMYEKHGQRVWDFKWKMTIEFNSFVWLVSNAWTIMWNNDDPGGKGQGAIYPSGKTHYSSTCFSKQDQGET